MKNTEKERAIMYREFCGWCETVPHLDLNPRLHTHGGRIEDGGYIADEVTAKAFSAWKAARCAPAAPQPQADALDAELYFWEIEEAARRLAESRDYPWAFMPEEGKARFRKKARAAIAAAKENK